MAAETYPRRSRLGNAFRLLWAATGVSNLGDGISLVVLPLLAASLTRDPVLIAGVATAQRLPWLLFTLVSGVLVDRADRRTLQRISNLFRAALFGLLGLAFGLGWVSLPLLFGVAFLLGTAETLFDNAATALLPAVVNADDLERANSRLITTQTVTNEFVGPPLGGILFALTQALPFFVTATCYAAAAGLVGLLRGNFRAVSSQPRSSLNLWQDIGEGLRWFWQHRLLHALAVKAAFEHGCWAATNALLVLVAQDRLGLNAAGFGAIMGAGAVGGVLGGVAATWWIARLGLGGASLLNLVIQAVAYAGIALTFNPVVAAVMLGLLSFTGGIGNVLGISFRQAVVPDYLLGRIISAFRLYALGAMPLGTLIGGLLAREVNLLAPYWVSSALLLLLLFALLPLVTNRNMNQARQAVRQRDQVAES